MTYGIGNKVSTSMYGKGRIIEKTKDKYKIKLDKPFGGFIMKTVTKDKVHSF